jgi:hypothetical protein
MSVVLSCGGEKRGGGYGESVTAGFEELLEVRAEEVEHDGVELLVPEEEVQLREAGLVVQL